MRAQDDLHHIRGRNLQSILCRHLGFVRLMCYAKKAPGGGGGRVLFAGPFPMAKTSLVMTSADYMQETLWQDQGNCGEGGELHGGRACEVINRACGMQR